MIDPLIDLQHEKGVIVVSRACIISLFAVVLPTELFAGTVTFTGSDSPELPGDVVSMSVFIEADSVNWETASVHFGSDTLEITDFLLSESLVDNAVVAPAIEYTSPFFENGLQIQLLVSNNVDSLGLDAASVHLGTLEVTVPSDALPDDDFLVHVFPEGDSAYSYISGEGGLELLSGVSPEPTSLSLLFLGSIALAKRRR